MTTNNFSSQWQLEENMGKQTCHSHKWACTLHSLHTTLLLNGLHILYLACASSGTLLALIFCPYFSLGSASIAQQPLELILTLTSISCLKELHFSYHVWLSEDTHGFWPRKEFIVDMDCTRGVQRQGYNAGIVRCCLVSQSPSLPFPYIPLYTPVYSLACSPAPQAGFSSYYASCL